MDYINEKLIVDELILDPSLMDRVVVRIGVDFYMLQNNVRGKLTEKDLRPYKKQVSNEWYRHTDSHNFWIRGLVPRGGYKVDIGRAATEQEFSQIIAKHSLGDDDISDVFTDSRGMIYGEDFAKSFQARQIKLESGGEAIALERELRSRGIEVSNGSPGRVNIRV